MTFSRLSSSRISFLIFMLACISGFCALGTWQVKRLHWKENLIAGIDAAYAETIKPVPLEDITSLAPDHFLRGKFRGFADFENAFDLSGQIDDGKQTSHKMLPLEISKTLTVLVDLGPDFKSRTPSRIVTLTGLLKNAPRTNRFTPDNDPKNDIWYSINPAQLPIKNLKPLVILPEKTPWKDYPATKPELRNAHLQYAIFWFMMAFITAGLTLVYLVRKDR